MAEDAKPYKEGKTWSLRRRLFGQDLYASGHTTGAAAKKVMDKLVLGLEQRGKPKGGGSGRLSPPASCRNPQRLLRACFAAPSASSAEQGADRRESPHEL